MCFTLGIDSWQRQQHRFNTERRGEAAASRSLIHPQLHPTGRRRPLVPSRTCDSSFTLTPNRVKLPARCETSARRSRARRASSFVSTITRQVQIFVLLFQQHGATQSSQLIKKNKKLSSTNPAHTCSPQTFAFPPQAGAAGVGVCVWGGHAVTKQLYMLH